MGGLWEFPGGPFVPPEPAKEACQRILKETLGVTAKTGQGYSRIQHAYSHFKITLHPYRCILLQGSPFRRIDAPSKWIPFKDLSRYAFPRAQRKLIEALERPGEGPTLFD